MGAATFWMRWGARRAKEDHNNWKNISKEEPYTQNSWVLSFTFFSLLGLFLLLESTDDPGLHTWGCSGRGLLPRQHSKQHFKLSDPRPEWYTDCIQPHGCRSDHRGLSGEEKYATGESEYRSGYPDTSVDTGAHRSSLFHELGTHRHIGQMMMNTYENESQWI